MGKPTSKIIETLVMPHQPIRYVVTNTEKIILVTHDFKYANKIANVIMQIKDSGNYYLKFR